MTRRPKREVTIYDVARDAGVSFGTVSRVLNGRKDVSPKTRAAVLESIRRLNYVQHPFARGLARNATGLIGFVSGGSRSSSDQHAYFVLELQRGILKGAGEYGYNVVIFDPDDYQAEAFGSFARLVEGLIIRGRVGKDFLEDVRVRFPIVGINNRDVKPNLSVDHHSGAEQAIEHLVQLGHRRIAMIPGAGAEQSPARVERESAYRSVLQRHGIEYDQELVSGVIGLNERAKLHATLDSFFRLSNRPTAIFVAGDLPALETMRYLTQRGFHVPRDVSVVGSTDLPISLLANPPLTTVHVPLEQIGGRAAALLKRMIEEPDEEVADELFTSHLVVRESTAPPPAR